MKEGSRQSADLGVKLERIASHMADELIAGQEIDEGKVTTFRALCAFLIMVNKLPPADGEEATAFNGFKNALTGLGTTSRGRRRATGTAISSGPGPVTLAADIDEFE